MLEDFLKQIGVTIDKVYKYGDKDGVTAWDIAKKMDNKKLMAEIIYEMHGQLLDCRKVINQLNTECIDNKTSITSKLESIEKVVKSSSTKTDKLCDSQKEYRDKTQEMQTELKSYSEVLLNI